MKGVCDTPKKPAVVPERSTPISGTAIGTVQLLTHMNYALFYKLLSVRHGRDFLTHTKSHNENQSESKSGPWKWKEKRYDLLKSMFV